MINGKLTPVIIYSDKLHLPATTRRMEFLQFSKAHNTSFLTRISYNACLQICRTNRGTSRLSASIPFTNNVPCPLFASLLVYCFPAYLLTCFYVKCEVSTKCANKYKYLLRKKSIFLELKAHAIWVWILEKLA